MAAEGATATSKAAEAAKTELRALGRTAVVGKQQPSARVARQAQVVAESGSRRAIAMVDASCMVPR
eukprot:835005-Prymnesium_polylepis.1